MITTTKQNMPIEEAIKENIESIGYAYLNERLVTVRTDHKHCIAKSVKTDNIHMASQKYYILVNHQRQVYDPFNPPIQRSQTLEINFVAGSQYWNFLSVTKEMFEYYLKFLRTRNTIYYNNINNQL